MDYIDKKSWLFKNTLKHSSYLAMFLVYSYCYVFSLVVIYCVSVNSQYLSKESVTTHKII